VTSYGARIRFPQYPDRIRKGAIAEYAAKSNEFALFQAVMSAVAKFLSFVPFV
jgi:hypothetical protein